MTKKKKGALLISALALIAVIVVGGTLAYFTSQDTAQNVFTLGKVSGDLTETTDDNPVDGHPVKPGTSITDGNGNETGIEYGKDNPVLPGDWLSKKPVVRLTDNSEDAYVRVKLTVTDTSNKLNDEQKKELLTSKCLNFGEGWVLGNSPAGTDEFTVYVYYQTPLTLKGENPNSSTNEVFTVVKIPGEWGNSTAGVTFSIDITADLIQADNFTPVKTGDTITSWGDVEIKK